MKFLNKCSRDPSPYPLPQGEGNLRIIFVSIAIILSACQPTYKKETLQQSVKELAKREYKLDVEVQERGNTLGIRYKVNNLLGEMVSEDQLVWKQMDDLMLVLSRITLSADVSPEFFVLEIMDADHPETRLLFTRYVQDVKKVMAEALSRNQYLDRLLIEFIIGEKRFPFDPNEMDMVRLMMMTADAPASKPGTRPPPFKLEPVDFRDFLAKVAANYMRRLLREEDSIKDDFQLRQVEGSYDRAQKGNFKILLDLVSQPETSQQGLGPAIEMKVLPLVAKETGKLFKSYKFSDFAAITVVEKNSGKVLTVAR